MPAVSGICKSVIDDFLSKPNSHFISSVTLKERAYCTKFINETSRDCGLNSNDGRYTLSNCQHHCGRYFI